MIALGLLGLVLVSPFIALFGALWRAAVLFLPVMWILNWTHTVIPMVPALEWWPTMLVIMLFSLIIPSGSSSSSSNE